MLFPTLAGGELVVQDVGVEDRHLEHYRVAADRGSPLLFE